ncbi:MAG: hypothetical protein LH472_10090 [Pyrinomonadaceae bacterium]|nr:hypothetical protein [Pyrinomonadaceae bacterium]
MIDFSIEIDPTIAAFERGLTADIEKLSTEIVREVVELAPVEMRDLMGNNPPSARGSAPARRTGNLANSLQGRLTGTNAGEIDLIYYSEFLDPFLGGKLDRPFALTGIDNAIVKVAKSL